MEWRWMDKTSGRRRVSHYWWSQNTNEITWEKPPELGGGANADMPEWVKVFSPSDERFYYYSNWTHETLWTIPENYTAPPTGMAARMLMSPELRGALVIQCVWRKKQARRVVRSAKARHMATIDNARVFRGWVTEWDHTAKADFYFNIDTGEISWTMPTVLMVPKWIKVHDPTTNWHYYVNNDTGEQQTTTPDDYQSPRGPHAKLLSKMITNPELRGAMAIQRAFRSRQSRRLAYASQLHRRMVEVAETYEAIIPRDGALGFHLVQPEGDVGGGRAAAVNQLTSGGGSGGGGGDGSGDAAGDDVGGGQLMLETLPDDVDHLPEDVAAADSGSGGGVGGGGGGGAGAANWQLSPAALARVNARLPQEVRLL